MVENGDSLLTEPGLPNLNEVLTEDRVATYPSEDAIRRAKSNEGSA